MATDKASSSSSQARPQKRARILAARGDDDYMRGNIIRIEVHNFMTYSQLEVRPGPRLNLVIGANGTGKSSLVCAIAIGLGGEPQLLGRAGHIGDFVKRGEQSGYTSISLRGDTPEETIVITRKITKQNRSEWLLNDKPASKKVIQDTVRQFNIQVNNLTQFLPQDRVCEFARLSPIELLEETEKAVGDPELSKQHESLVELKQEFKQRELTVRQLETSLNQLKAYNAELERDVERVQERNRLNERAEALRKKLPWLMYDKEKSLYTETKDRERQARNHLQKITEELARLQVPIRERKRERDALDDTLKAARDLKTRKERERREIRRQVEQERNRADRITREIAELRQAEAQRQERIENARKSLAEAEMELQNFQVNDTQEEMGPLVRQIRDLESELDNRSHRLQELQESRRQKLDEKGRCDRRIEQLHDRTNQRLEILRALVAPRIFEAYRWVQEHRGNFKQHVYGPVLLEIRIPTKKLASYVEGHVSSFIWKAFITQSEEDRDLLNEHLKQFKVPVINYTGAQAPTFTVTAEMERLGVERRLDEAIEAPEVVKEVLNGQFSLAYSVVGNDRANKNADKLCNLGVRDLWTPENHYRWKVSRYGGHISASADSVVDARFFSPSVDTKELEELEERKRNADVAIAALKEEIERYTAQQCKVENDLSVLNKRREELVEGTRQAHRQRASLASTVEQRRKRLDTLRNQEDFATAESRFLAEISEINQSMFRKAMELKERLLHSVDKYFDYCDTALSFEEHGAKIKAMEAEFRTRETSGVQAQQDYDTCKAEVTERKECLRKAKANAERVAVITPELQADFATMPDTIEDLEDSIENLLAQARTVFCPNPNVLQEYENRCKQIAENTSKLETEAGSLNACRQEVERIQTSWLSSLRKMVGKINDSFSRNFEEMAIAGEVSLDEQGMDFDKYGIHLKVKFRAEEQLQILSAHHHSGGEKAVSTILYLVSLQDLTHCSFRVVDEINQGMDPINERKMFQQLVRAASQPNTPQCFLLTPKLLPELNYSEACSVLNVMNGPWNAVVSEVFKSGCSYSITCRDIV